jgi:hypothetical protein
VTAAAGVLAYTMSVMFSSVAIESNPVNVNVLRRGVAAGGIALFETEQSR